MVPHCTKQTYCPPRVKNRPVTRCTMWGLLFDYVSAIMGPSVIDIVITYLLISEVFYHLWGQDVPVTYTIPKASEMMQLSINAQACVLHGIATRGPRPRPQQPGRQSAMESHTAIGRSRRPHAKTRFCHWICRG